MKEIMNRRSVREFREKHIPADAVTKLLGAAMRAPSAGNEQPWEFIIMRKRTNMEAILQFHQRAMPLNSADLAVTICGDTKRQKFPHDYWVQDCSAATQNLLLEAQHLGIGAVWLGIYPIEERVNGLQKLLHLPKHIIPLGVIALGYPVETPSAIDTYKPERIHEEQWTDRG